MPKRYNTLAAAGIFSLVGAAAGASLLHLDDVIIDHSLCVGQSCSVLEVFGDDTVRLKENVVRLKFDDTSTGGAPANDWQFTINDATIGGADQFALDDLTGGTVPFVVRASAPSHALFVAASGNLGLGTANPLSDLHVVAGDSPALRLEQDGTGGFSGRIWDVLGNDVGFHVRDVTSGLLPFKIEPDAPGNSMVVDSTSFIGLGTDAPQAKLHLHSGPLHTEIWMQQTGDTPQIWRVRNNENTGRLVFASDTTVPFKIDQAAVSGLFRLGVEEPNRVNVEGNLVVEKTTPGTGNIVIEGTITTTGSCAVGCDAVFDDDYDLPSIADHAQMMFAQGYLPNVGPTADGMAFDLNDKLGRMLNELEHAHIYIAELNARIETLEQALTAR